MASAKIKFTCGYEEERECFGTNEEYLIRQIKESHEDECHVCKK